MSDHAKYSPSALTALSKCLRFKYNETKENVDASDEGTMMHKAFETGDLRGLTEEQARAVESANAFVDSILATEGGPENWRHMKEQRVTLRDITYGTADRVLIHKTHPVIHVIDAKFGRAVGDYELQVKTYSAAVLEALQEMDAANIEDVTVHTHVIIPRASVIETVIHPNGQALLIEVRETILALYARLDDWFNGPTPHADTCDKCANAYRCPALSHVATTAGGQLGVIMPSFDMSADVSPNDRALRQVLAGALINWGEQVKAANAQFVKDGGELEGFKLVTRSTGFRVPAEFTSAAVAALKSAGFSEDIILGSCTLTMGRLTTAVSEHYNVPESAAREQIQQAIRELGQEGSTQFLQKSKRISDEALAKQLMGGLIT